jgi:hypothetical protein
MLEGEAAVRDGAANHQRGLETVGGRLFLTDRRLVFESHGLNLQNAPTVIDLADVSGIEPGWTLFLGVVPLMPNALIVRLRDGTVHRFTLWGRAAWSTAIGQALKAAVRA